MAKHASLLADGIHRPLGQFKLVMNAKVFLLCFVSAAAGYAADTPPQLNTSLHSSIPSEGDARWRGMLTVKPDSPIVALGKSDFNVSGPLVEAFRRLPHREDLSTGQKFLRLPIVRLFVPKPMPMPPGTGKYFRWRDADVPWAEAASRPPILKGPN